MKMFLLHSCDNHHTHQSNFLHGAFTSRATALEAIHELIAKAPEEERDNRPPLGDEQAELFMRIGQTQGYGGEGEFILKELELNKIYIYL